MNKFNQTVFSSLTEDNLLIPDLAKIVVGYVKTSCYHSIDRKRCGLCKKTGEPMHFWHKTKRHVHTTCLECSGKYNACPLCK